MTASNKERKNIEEHLPHDLLKELYLNSRVSIKQLEEKFGISHHTLSKCLKDCEEKYKLHYTIDVDTNLLGFSEARILAIKFEKMPDIKLLKKVLEKDLFVQNAYTASGDYDLILHIIGSNRVEYENWEFKFRIGFSNYKPVVKTSTLNHFIEGFMPIKSDLILKSESINEAEKVVLAELVKNSRIKIKNLAKVSRLSEIKVIYTIDKLQKSGIIKQFTSIVQNPDKRIFLFYSINIMITGDHHPRLLLRFLNKIINEEKIGNVTTDYSVVCDTSGYFDSVYICNFEDGTALRDRGPNFLNNVWESEFPKIKQSILTEIVTGKWPFNLNNYINLKVERKIEEEKPIIFPVYD
jgi:DNA-binding Lrp family transcriptional regulator